MKRLNKYILFLVLLNVLLLVTAYFLISVVKLNLLFTDIIILSAGFSIVAVITFIIFLKGQVKEPDSQTLYSLVAVSVKFLLELLFALAWFIVAKKTSLQSVLIFFVLYLALTSFSVFIILKILKNKSL